MEENSEEKQNPLHLAEVVLVSYLSNFSPADYDTPGVIIRSTDDILRELDDMVELPPNQIAAFLLLAGYTTCFHEDGRHGWMMRRVPRR